MVILDALKVDIPAEPRRHRKRGWCESAETSDAFEIAWTAREDARKLVRTPPPPPEKTAWKTFLTACANRRKVTDRRRGTVISNSMLLKWRDYSPKTTSGICTST